MLLLNDDIFEQGDRSLEDWLHDCQMEIYNIECDKEDLKKKIEFIDKHAQELNELTNEILERLIKWISNLGSMKNKLS